jgi:tetratricopeptide (TPR) repeat protein
MKNKLLILVMFSINAIYSQIPNLTTIVKKTDKSIVKIYTLDHNDQYISQGSGVLISEKGIGITNFHVLNGAKKAIIINYLGQKAEITTIIDYSEDKDLVKFKFSISNFNFIPSQIFINKTEKGQNVFTLGYPSGFEIEGGSTLSTGIISGFRKVDNQNFIQTTAPITHGSSGGGMFDEFGKLCGITCGTFASDIEDLHANLNKVIPANEIVNLNQQLNLSINDFYSEISYNNTFILAMEAYESLNFEKSIELFDDYLNKFPNNQFAWFRLGNSYNQIGRYTYDKETLNNSISCLLKAIELDENYYYAHYQVSWVYSYLKVFDNALFHAFKAKSIEPNNPSVYILIGTLYAMQKKDLKSIEYYKQSIEIKESDRARLEMAYSLLRLSQKYEAELNFKRCLELNPNYQECLFQYSLFLFNNKRKNESCYYLNKLYSINPKYNNQNIANIISSKCKN